MTRGPRTWLLCSVNVLPANKVSLLELNHLPEIELPTLCFLENLLLRPNFQGVNARFAPPCGRPCTG